MSETCLSESDKLIMLEVSDIYEFAEYLTLYLDNNVIDDNVKQND